MKISKQHRYVINEIQGLALSDAPGLIIMAGVSAHGDYVFHDLSVTRAGGFLHCSSVMIGREGYAVKSETLEGQRDALCDIIVEARKS